MDPGKGAWGRGRGGQPGAPPNPWGRGRGAPPEAPAAPAQRAPQVARGDGDARPVAGQGGQSAAGRGGGGQNEAGREDRQPNSERGRVEGRGARRGVRDDNKFDMVVSRPTVDGKFKKKQAVVKTAEGVQTMMMKANYFKVTTRPDWCVFHYHVDFRPDEENTRTRKKLMRVHESTLKEYIFDGGSLYSSHRLTPNEQPLLLYSKRDSDQEKIQLELKFVGELQPTDIMYLQIFNILVRRCLEAMELTEVNRNFFDNSKAIRLPEHRLELWPGFKTSMRNRENDILLEVELATKVLRLDNCLDVIRQLKNNGYNDLRIKGELCNSVIMTMYNHATYKIDDIDYNTTPSSTFDFKGRQLSFMQYYKEKHGITIREPRQPMLVSRPKKRDLHRGNQGPILLIPELCQMTGLTDEMRANFTLTRALATHMNIEPERRNQKLTEFITKLQSLPNQKTTLNDWGLAFQNKLVEFQGHRFPSEKINFGNNATETPTANSYDWSHAFKNTHNMHMLSTVGLRHWVVIVPNRNADCVDKLVKAMQRVAAPLNFHIANPVEVINLANPQPNEYANTVDMVMNKYRDKVQMVFTVLPKIATDNYSAVKKRACIEFGVPSQCFVAKNAYNDKGLMSICTKVVVQMNAKLGGEPWSVKIPISSLMIVGFDVYHAGKGRGASVGAMVSTTSPTMAKHFSCTSYHSTREEVSEKMGTDFTKCLYAYSKCNQTLPERIIMYRDGVGEGHLKYIHETELNTIRAAITNVYQSAGKSPPKFMFIVVTKRINTRIFSDFNGRLSNPGPGSVVDDVITLPERYDFYLISQFTRQGTVSPVAYNVLHDSLGLPPERVQQLTYKLCHMYFNWSGTVKVPAPCQYAHKLAYLTGLSLGNAAHERLSNSLYFL